MGLRNFKYKKMRKIINDELLSFKTDKEKGEYLNDVIEELKDLKQTYDGKKDKIVLSDLIKNLSYKIYRINKHSDITIKIKKTKTKNMETKNLSSKMKIGTVAISNEPITYINALIEYISCVDIGINYNNIMYYITELQQNFVKDNYSVIIQKYYIKYLIDVLKKQKKSYRRNDSSRLVLKKIINYLKNIEYRNTDVLDVEIKYIDPTLIDSILRKNNVLKKTQKELGIYDNNEFILNLINYLENEVSNIDNSSKFNKYFNITDYLVSSITIIDIEYYEIIKNKLLLIRKQLSSKINFKDKHYLNTPIARLHNEVSELINKIDRYQVRNMIYKDDISVHRTVKYIINDLRSIELLEAIILKIPDSIDEKLFYETIETYFNIVLNSNNFSLVIYYQKVIEKIFINSNLSKDRIKIVLNNHIDSIIESETLRNRKDYKERINLLKHTLIILNKTLGYHYDEILGDYTLDKKEINYNNYIFTLDSNGTKTYENAFNVKKEIDSYILTLYTSDISSYLKDSFKSKLNEFLNMKAVYLGKKSHEYSLEEGLLRPVIAYEFEFDFDNNFKNLNIYKTDIIVSKNLHYNTTLETINELDINISNEILYLLSICSNIYYKDKEVKAPTSLAQLNSLITYHCNSLINSYFIKQGLPLIDRESINVYQKYMNEITHNDKQIPNLNELLDLLHNMYKSGVIYTSSNYNLIVPKHSKISSPMREIDSLINQLLSYYYFNKCNNISKDEANMLNFMLDNICDSLNTNKVVKNKVKKIDKNKKCVKIK